jgi:hypothetical protein
MSQFGGRQLDAALGRIWQGHRGDARVTGNASELFGQSAALNQLLYGVGVTTSFKVSPRVLWNVGDFLTSTYARDATALSDSRLLPPTLLTHLNTLSSGLTYDWSPTTQVRWTISEQGATFQSSRLAGGSTTSTRLHVARQLSRSQQFGIAGTYQRTLESGTIATIQGLLGTYQRTLGPNAVVGGTAGMSVYTTPGQKGVQTAPVLSVILDSRFRHGDTLRLRYDRLFETALGVGTHLTQGVGATYSLTVGRRLLLTGGGDYTTGSYPFDPNHKLIGRTATVAAQYTLVHDLALAFSSAVFGRTDTPNPRTLKTQRTSMSLVYLKAWH